VITALLARRLLTPLETVEDAVLVIEDGIISAVAARADISLPPNARVVDFGDAILTPGLIDIHIHGGADADVAVFTSSGEVRKTIVRGQVG
jgi:imidazolonepropionase-like amidohydrolase